MKKLLLATTVAVVLAAPVRAAEIYNWSGLYIGAHVGYGSAMKSWYDVTGDFQATGFLGGAQVGFNQQIGNLVFGVEADATWASIQGDQTVNLGGAPIGFF